MSWVDRIFSARDRLLMSAKFRRAAIRFPLTRGIARHRAREVFDLCAGFVYSQVLLACVQLQLFDILKAGPLSLEQLADSTRIPREAMQRLARAAVSLRLLATQGADYRLGSLGATLVDNAAITAMILHHGLVYNDLRDPIALLRGESHDTKLNQFWAYTGTAAADPRVATYSALMTQSNALVAEEILDAYSMGRHKCLLDVGGGEGAFVSAVAARHSQISLMLYDLPAVAELANTRLQASAFGARVRIFGGDFLRDLLPAGADVATLVRVIHDHDDDAALAILTAVRLALPNRGVLLLAEPMSDAPGAEPVGDAYFGFYLLAMGRGRPRRPDELKKLLRRAGFCDIRLLKTRMPLQTQLLLAHAA